MANQIAQMLWLLVVLALSHSKVLDINELQVKLYCEVDTLNKVADNANKHVRCNYIP